MTVEVMRDGSYMIYEIIDGELCQRKFYYTSKKESIKEFNKYFKKEEVFESLESDQVACAMPNYGGWLTIEVELEDADWVGERDNAIELMVELELINEEEASELYRKEEIKQIIFAI
jgi:hypothetical protein